MISRRRFLANVATAAGALPFARLSRALASPLAAGLSDPLLQPKFAALVPNALHPGFKWVADPATGEFSVPVAPAIHYSGLIDSGGSPLPTPIFAYGGTWPGRTFEPQSGVETVVHWKNELFGVHQHLVPVDTSLHWAYSDPGRGLSIAEDGVPIITHLHGGHSDFLFDGNPEFWYSPGGVEHGPSWDRFNGGVFTDRFVYDNSQVAGTLWYHDHALGITRLNVYAGMAGFYILRDAVDTGRPDNPLGLPAYPYELAYAIQDRMFKSNGELFYPAFPGDPFYSEFIYGEGAVLPPEVFPDGGPTALAEFFGDHMVVNGMIWPKAGVEPRNYRMRLLNGCDSRFLSVRFRVGLTPNSTDLARASRPVPFWVIGSDQGLASKAAEVDKLLIGPGERYDIVFDFSRVPFGSRVIMENVGPDVPFGGKDADEGFARQGFFPDRQTDRVMAFDVVLPLDTNVADRFDPAAISGFQPPQGPADRVRRVALFEGTDEFGRLQPLLGTAEPTQNSTGLTVNGAIAWSSPTTENPGLGDEEIWEIYNATGDAHPIHLHLVHFQILDRQKFIAKTIEQDLVEHNGEIGTGFRLDKIKVVGRPRTADESERAPKDMVTALPGERTRIRVRFDKPGRYVWHCHILSHEDHEMMRVLHVGPGA